jgi:hypothetical protein
MGDTVECLVHLVERHSAEAVRPLLAEFCGVVDDTVRRWINQGKLPLRTFLHLAGYTIDELAELPRMDRELVQVVGLGILSPETVRTELGYKNVQDVYRVLLRGAGVMSDKRRKVENILKASEGELKRRRARWQARLEDSLGVSRSSEPAAPVTAVDTSLLSGVAHEPEIVEHLMFALSYALENGSQDRGSGKRPPKPLPERRIKAIREYVDDDLLHRLIAQLTMLS